MERTTWRSTLSTRWVRLSAGSRSNRRLGSKNPALSFSFQKISWEDLAAKKVPAPFKPVIRDELDVSNFAEEFTEMDPTYSPAALPQNCDRIFQVGGGGVQISCDAGCFRSHVRTLLRAPRRSWHRTAFPVNSCEGVCLGFGRRLCCMLTQIKKKIALCIIRFCLPLYLKYSGHQVKFWMS